MAWGICNDSHVRSMKQNLIGLRRLSIKFLELPPFAGVWNTVGDTLQEFAFLELSDLSSSDETRTGNFKNLALENFRTCCRNIIKLRFESSQVEVRPSLVKLYRRPSKNMCRVSHCRNRHKRAWRTQHGESNGYGKECLLCKLGGKYFWQS